MNKTIVVVGSVAGGLGIFLLAVTLINVHRLIGLTTVISETLRIQWIDATH